MQKDPARRITHIQKLVHDTLKNNNPQLASMIARRAISREANQQENMEMCLTMLKAYNPDQSEWRASYKLIEGEYHLDLQNHENLRHILPIQFLPLAHLNIASTRVKELFLPSRLQSIKLSSDLPLNSLEPLFKGKIIRIYIDKIPDSYPQHLRQKTIIQP